MHGEHAKAEAVLRKVLQVFPNYPLARNNLAIALCSPGQNKRSGGHVETANVSAAPEKGGYPRTWEAARNLARLRHNEKDDVAAFSILEQAHRDYPRKLGIDRFSGRNRSGKLKVLARALPIVKNFVREHWWHAGASIALGGLFAEIGDLPQAEEAFRHASVLDVHDAEALNLMALLKREPEQARRRCARPSAAPWLASPINRANILFFPIFSKKWDEATKHAPRSRKLRIFRRSRRRAQRSRCRRRELGPFRACSAA